MTIQHRAQPSDKSIGNSSIHDKPPKSLKISNVMVIYDVRMCSSTASTVDAMSSSIRGLHNSSRKIDVAWQGYRIYWYEVNYAEAVLCICVGIETLPSC